MQRPQRVAFGSFRASARGKPACGALATLIAVRSPRNYASCQARARFVTTAAQYRVRFWSGEIGQNSGEPRRGPVGSPRIRSRARRVYSVRIRVCPSNDSDPEREKACKTPNRLDHARIRQLVDAGPKEAAVHDANGLGPETCFGVDAVNVDAQATPAAMAPAKANRTTSATGLRALMNHPLCCSAH
jgi:hypothetical protein